MSTVKNSGDYTYTKKKKKLENRGRWREEGRPVEILRTMKQLSDVLRVFFLPHIPRIGS